MERNPANSNVLYPVIFFPKNCMILQTECDAADNLFMDLKIMSLDTEGNETSIYNGLCNIKLTGYNEIVHDIDSLQTQSYENISPIAVTEAKAVPNSSYNQSQVWIDPTRSPYVYNNYEGVGQELSVYNSNMTVEQHNTYITQNVYNYNETDCNEFEHKKFRKVQTTELNQTVDQLDKDDEYECGVMLSLICEDIEKENCDNEALKQLMYSDILSQTKQQKTILYLGNDSQYGQTIQNIAINDPCLECGDNVLEEGVESGDNVLEEGVESGDNVLEEGVESEHNRINKKRYQCDKCKQIFDQLSTFKQHVVSHRRRKLPVNLNDGLTCGECGKTLRSREKLDLHRLRHGDPDHECDWCKKVFVSKFTLRNHLKIHTRKYCCSDCTKSYSSAKDLATHLAKIHFIFVCDQCDFTTNKNKELDVHKDIHKIKSETESALPVHSSGSTEAISTDSEEMSKHEQIRQADSVIAKVINNEVFLMHAKKAKKHRKFNKKCEVCHKIFDRIGDLKRHLIEHMIRSTLAKTPVNSKGTLTILCEVCQRETFSKVDKYKAHLRKHAKLTIYNCTFCDKSFSDSSNFSKHKKIHGTTFFQCDHCKRKFNSKKMIAQHMDHHMNNSPLPCLYCHKVFHFESMLNKHIKYSHTRELVKFRCRFCREYFRSLKEKWDHEWKVHNVRKIIVDCLICGTKFRKYSELKRHCNQMHDVEIPLAKILKNNSQGNRK